MVNFNKTPVEKTGCLGILYFCLLVPRHPVFRFTVHQLGDLQDAIPYHWSHKLFLSLLSPREAEDFSEGWQPF